MERIETPDKRFHDGDPFNGVEGTVVTADWLNTVQEEIATVITDAGIELDPTATDQLSQAIGQRLADFAYSKAQSDLRYLQSVEAATTNRAGIVELATPEEASAGLDDDLAVTPQGVAASIAEHVVADDPHPDYINISELDFELNARRGLSYFFGQI